MAQSDKGFDNFYLIVIAWFVFSFFLMWFVGGACTDIVHGTSCLAPNALQGLGGVPILGLFFPYDAWQSLMYFLAPIAGFVMAFVLVRWWNGYFETKEAATLIFPVILIIALLAGYYINLSIYVGENARLGSSSNVRYSTYFCFGENDASQCYSDVSRINQQLIASAQSANVSTFSQYVPVAFWAEVRKSMFFLFILGAIAGWIPLFAKGLYEKYREKEHS